MAQSTQMICKPNCRNRWGRGGLPVEVESVVFCRWNRWRCCCGSRLVRISFPLDSIVLIPRLSQLSLLTAKPEAVNFSFLLFILSREEQAMNFSFVDKKFFSPVKNNNPPEVIIWLKSFLSASDGEQIFVSNRRIKKYKVKTIAQTMGLVTQGRFQNESSSIVLSLFQE